MPTRFPRPREFADLAALVTARTELALRGDSTDAARMLSVITAAGVGPVLPVRLLSAALGEADTVFPVGRIRDSVAECGALISRGNPGTGHETLGISHLALLQPVTDYITVRGFDPRGAHQGIIDACQRLAGMTDSGSGVADDDVVTYWITAAPRHYLAAGNPGAAIQFLKSLDTPRPADNRDRWASWLPTFTTTLGPDHRDTLRARAHLAYWRGEAGDVARAVAAFEAVLADRVRVLGPDHPDTLSTRHNLAAFQGEAGDAAGAVAAFEAVLADRVRVQGPDHPDTLTARHNLAYWRGEAGDVAGAVTEFEAVLADRVRVQGPDHPDTLSTRHSLAYWRGEAGDVAGAVAALETLLADVMRVLGPDHPDTLTIRRLIAQFGGDGSS